MKRFRNGDSIPEVRSQGEWEKAGKNKQPAWCYYEKNPANGKIYGKLCNWYAVNDPRELAPKGWHIPSDKEWTILIDHLGGEKVAGGKMKITGTQYKGATNESGFSGLPGGYRASFGEFGSIGTKAQWWSSSEVNSAFAWSHFLFYDHSDFYGDNDVNRYSSLKEGGFPFVASGIKTICLFDYLARRSNSCGY